MAQAPSRWISWMGSAPVVAIGWLLCLALLAPAATLAADGSLDTTFGAAHTGLVTTDFGSGSSDQAYALAIQSDGKTVVVGYTDASGSYDFALARYDTDGSPDTSFGGAHTGLVTTDFGSGSYDQAYALAIQSDGKLLVAGMSDASSSGDFALALARYNADGSLDTSFGLAHTGFVTTDVGSHSYEAAHALAIQSDGKIVVAGASDASGSGDFALARYTADGSLDTSFGPGGTGLVTTDFGGSSNDQASALAIRSDGRIVVAGYRSNPISYDFALARYTADGSLDSSFGPGGNGLVTTDFGGDSRDFAYALAIQSDGKILVAGESDVSGSVDFALARYTADGSLDTSFGPGGSGLVTTDFGSSLSDAAIALAIQNDGKILAAGYSTAPGTYDFALARYDGDGSLDLSFGPGGSGLVTTYFGGGSAAQAYALGVRGDGKLLAAGIGYVSGSNDFGLARYTITLPVTAVPALDGVGLALLVLLLAVTALVVVGRHG